MKRDFLSLFDFRLEELEEILALSADLKRQLKEGKRPPLLSGRTLAMLFEKPSLRTRVTFEVGMTQLGGYAIYLTPTDIRIGERESVADIARNLDRWVDCIMARTNQHSTLVELAQYASIPVINALSDVCHPCQVLSDCLTLREHKGSIKDLHIAFVGDGNNVAHSWISAAAVFGFRFSIACPRGYDPDTDTLERAHAMGADIQVTERPEEALAGADAVYTDVWTSMGQEEEAPRRRRHFRGYQVNAQIMQNAKPDAVVMHCLPAHRGEEITNEVIEGPQSIVFDQAENRLHVQKGILVWLDRMSGKAG
jgi:ornithine carbamoyltransferase